jgi:hypothetical protein
MLLMLLPLLVALALFMTAPKAYRENSVTWKGSAIPAVQDVNEQETTEGVHQHRSDNATTAQAIFVDGIGCDLSVTTTDLSLRGTAGYTIGSNGVLVTVAEQRAEGIGSVGGGNKTHTYGDATLVAISHGLPINGKATMVLGFKCADPTGVAVGAFT